MSDEFGLTSAGLNPKTSGDVRESINDRLRRSDEFGEDAPIDDGPVAELVGAISPELAEVWSLSKAVYDQLNPDMATGTSLDNILSLGLLGRTPPTRSTGTVEFTGDANTEIEEGVEIRRSDTDARFRTTESAVIPDTGATEGEETVEVDIESIEFGPIEAPVGTIDDVVSSVPGVESVDNTEEVIVGSLREKDADARLRREQSLAVRGAGVDFAIRSQLLEIDDVQAAFVKSNRSDDVDEFGTPPGFSYVVIWPDTVDETDVADTLFRVQPAGGRMYGDDVEVEVRDAQGFEQKVSWDWAERVELYAVVEIETSDAYPDGGEDEVKQAILEVADGLDPGDDVIVVRYVAEVTRVDGITDVDVFIGESPSPTSDSNIDLEINEIALFDEDRIDVTDVS